MRICCCCVPPTWFAPSGKRTKPSSPWRMCPWMSGRGRSMVCWGPTVPVRRRRCGCAPRCWLRRRVRSGSMASTRCAIRSGPGPGWAWSWVVSWGSTRGLRHATTCCSSPIFRALTPDGDTVRSWTPWSVWGWSRRRPARRASCLEGCGSVCTWPGRCSGRRLFCCWMSPPPAWTRTWRCRCATWCVSWRSGEPGCC